MLKPKRTFASVVRELEAGLTDNSIVLQFFPKSSGPGSEALISGIDSGEYERLVTLGASAASNDVEGGKSNDPLIKRAQGGDERALEALWGRFCGSVRAIASRMVPPSEVENVIQEVFIAVWKGLQGFRGDCQFGTWVRKITVNKSLECLRLRQRAGRTCLFAELVGEGIADQPFEDFLQASCPQADSPEVELLRREIREIVGNELKTLPREHQMALWMSAAEEMTESEIGTLTGWPLGTVRSRIQRARKKLRQSEILSKIGRWI